MRPYVGSRSNGASKAASKPSKESGITKGCFCGGIFGGKGGSCSTGGSGFRGSCRKGSSDFRYVVYTFGRLDMLSKGKSRLDLG